MERESKHFASLSDVALENTHNTHTQVVELFPAWHNRRPEYIANPIFFVDHVNSQKASRENRE